MYNPYTSPAWGYGLGPQYSSVRGALAYGILGGPQAFGGGGMGGMGGLTGMSMLSGFGGGMPYGSFAGYAQPGLLSGQYNYLGPYGRYPGSTGTTGYGSNQGYTVYNGYGSYPGIGGLGIGGMGTGGMGIGGMGMADYDHYGSPWSSMQGSQPIPGMRPSLAAFGLAGPGGSIPPVPVVAEGPMGGMPRPFNGAPNHYEGDGHHGRVGVKDSHAEPSSFDIIVEAPKRV